MPPRTFIARQPIFDRNQEVVAYELLFRTGMNERYDGSDPERATGRVIFDSLLEVGLESITGGRPAYVNATREALITDQMAVLPAANTVIELVETIQPDAAVLDACRRLKQGGYRLALDDFDDNDGAKAFLPLADIVKVDFIACSVEKRRAIVRDHHRSDLQFLAEKVESPKEFAEALELGYQLFQGYFFAKPTVLSGKRISGSRLQHLQLLGEFQKGDLDFVRMEEVLRRDVSISYRLLRYINSAHFGLRHKVSSIRQALILLGERELRKWLSLLTLAVLAEEKPDELFLQASIRAKFCEALAALSSIARDRQPESFLLGMFSLIDAMLDRPLHEILGELPIEDVIRDALMGEDNDLSRIFKCALAYERGDWAAFVRRAQEMGLDVDYVSDLYIEAVAWAEDSFSSI